MEQQFQRDTYTIDATGKPLGRLAAEAAAALRGKHRPTFEEHVDHGAKVVVQNINRMVLTGKKLQQKVYYRNTGYPGGIRVTQAKDLIKSNPAKMLQMAVKNMLPDTRLRNNMLKRLTIE